MPNRIATVVKQKVMTPQNIVITPSCVFLGVTVAPAGFKSAPQRLQKLVFCVYSKPQDGQNIFPPSKVWNTFQLLRCGQDVSSRLYCLAALWVAGLIWPAPSLMNTTWPAATSFKMSTAPLGHRASIVCAFVALPSQIWTRMWCCE